MVSFPLAKSCLDCRRLGSAAAWHCSECAFADAPKARRPVFVARARTPSWRNLQSVQATGEARRGRHLGESASPKDGSRWASDDKSRRAFLKGAEARLSLHLSMEPRRPGVRGARNGSSWRWRRAEKPLLGSDQVGDEVSVTGSGSGPGCSAVSNLQLSAWVQSASRKISTFLSLSRHR